MLKQDLKEELKKSMIDRNELRTSVMRMLLSAINYYEIQKGGANYEATDTDVMSVIQTQIKQRKDSIESFEKAGRRELADKEKKEMEMLQVYLPPQLSEEEITQLVNDAIAQTGAKSIAEIGKVMGFLMPKTKNKADGNLVSKIVKEKLAQ